MTRSFPSFGFRPDRQAVLSIGAAGVSTAVITGLSIATAEHATWPILWPVVGFGAGLLLVAGWRWWPVAALCLIAFDANWGHGVGPTLLKAAFDLGHVGLVVWLFGRLTDRSAPTDAGRLRNVLALVAASGLASAIVSTVAAALFRSLGQGIDTSAIVAWTRWWAAAGLGTLFVLATILAWATPSPPDREGVSLAESGGLVFAVLGTNGLAFLSPGDSWASVASFALPPLLWGGVRFGPRGITAIVLCITSFALLGTWINLGPFVDATGTARSLKLQLYLAVVGVCGIVGGAIITERRTAMARLHESQRKLTLAQLALDGGGDLIFFVDDRGRFTYANDAACTRLGYSREEICELSIPDINVTLTRGEWIERWNRRRREPHGHYEAVLRTKAGDLFPAEITTSYVSVGGEALYCAIARDITERCLDEQRLRASEERLRSLVEHLPFGAAYVSQGSLTVNRAIERLTGFDRSELTTVDRWFTVLFGAEADRVKAEYEANRASGFPRAVMVTITRRDGESRVIEAAACLAGDVEVWVMHDVTERQRAEAALRRSEEELREAQRIAGISRWEYDIANDRFQASPHMSALLGLADGRTAVTLEEVLSVVAPEEREVLRQRVATMSAGGSSAAEYTLRIVLPEAGERYVTYRAELERDASGRPIRIVGTVQDVTERRKAEAERRELELKLQHRQKLESLGVLAGGIAHDFNNLLVGVLGNASLALEDLDPNHPAYESIRRVETSAMRAADLVRQLLTYAGKSHAAMRPTSLPALVRETRDLLGTVLSKKAVLRCELPDDLPLVLGDEAQLRQVVMNLLTNASEALGDEPGFIDLRAGVRSLISGEVRCAQTGEPLEAGRYIWLMVEDTGCGMPPETRDRIFEPFFTTKFTGRGLGLAAVVGIVRAHQGAIVVDSTPGAGTRFTVYLPVATPVAQVAPAREPSGEWTGGGLVLLADDEPAVRSLAERVLKSRGFEVVTASDGDEALELFDTHADDLVLAVLDLTMPRRGGLEVLAGLRARRPELPVVLSSGYSDAHGRAASESAGVMFIQKPYRPGDLVATVGRALSGSRQGTANLQQSGA